jgi:hypothetical protein
MANVPPMPPGSTVPSSPAPAGPTVPAALVHDFSEDVSQQLRRIEEALDALHVLARSTRREADRARDGL